MALSETVEEKEGKIKAQLNRILGALKIDPYEVLDLKYTASEADISKAYRSLSLQIHPDKCPGYLKEDAQSAFAKLTSAKNDLSSGHQH